MTKDKPLNLNSLPPNKEVLFAKSYTIRSVPSKGSVFPRKELVLFQAHISQSKLGDNNELKKYAFVSPDQRLIFKFDAAVQLGEQAFLPLEVDIYENTGGVYKKVDAVRVSVLNVRQ